MRTSIQLLTTVGEDLSGVSSPDGCVIVRFIEQTRENPATTNKIKRDGSSCQKMYLIYQSASLKIFGFDRDESRRASIWLRLVAQTPFEIYSGVAINSYYTHPHALNQSKEHSVLACGKQARTLGFVFSPLFATQHFRHSCNAAIASCKLIGGIRSGFYDYDRVVCNTCGKIRHPESSIFCDASASRAMKHSFSP